MNVEIKPEETGGEIHIPPSKSISHRAVIAASLANGTSRIDHVMLSRDIKATVEAVKMYGAEVTAEQEEDGLFTLLVTGTPEPQAHDCLIDCEESGSTVRFLLPILALDADNAVVTGQGRLPERPLKPIIDILEQQNFSCERGEKELPLILSGKLSSGRFEMQGNVSSQFITGLFFALPLLEGDSTITITSPLESKPYVQITLSILQEFGIDIQVQDDEHYFIPGGQAYRPTSLEVEGDFSQAAFWLVNGLINKKTVCLDLPSHSVQGDFAVIELLRKAGGKIEWEDGAWTAYPSNTHGFSCSVTDTPDLFPVLAVLAALSNGSSELTGGARLRFKESDRIAATGNMIRALGGHAQDEPEGMRLSGVSAFQSAVVDSQGDHRIAMAAAVASGRSNGSVQILDAGAVAKSYPGFWDDFEEAGGIFHELKLEK